MQLGSVDTKHHSSLEADIESTLTNMGFLLGTSAYHATLSSLVQSRLRRIETPTSLVARTRADKIAVHRTKPCCFFIDAKTGTVRPGQDFMPELVQFLSHRIEHDFLGADTLYVYRNIHSGFTSCFFVGESDPKPTLLLIGKQKEHLKTIAQRWCKFYWTIATYVCRMPGSGDPCLRIPEKNMTPTTISDVVSQKLNSPLLGKALLVASSSLEQTSREKPNLRSPRM